MSDAQPSSDVQTKICPRCGLAFQCHAARVEVCDCRKLAISPATTALIEGRYRDCLCSACLSILDAENSADQPDIGSGEESGRMRK